VLIKAAHIVELRARLDEARAALGLSPATYTDPGLTAGTIVKAVHIQELRQRVTEALAGGSAPISADGLTTVSYDVTTNRINTSGFQYDAAGNQTRIVRADGSAQKFQYDAANRLANVRTDASVVIATYTYGDSNERLIADEGGVRTYYASEGGSVFAEYTEGGTSTTPSWSKSYIYLGARLLSTLEPNGSGGETVRHHHPDRLGTRLVTNPSDGSYFEQASLPFGTALNAESTGSTNRRFASYDRSVTTGLDYAINRHYDPQQGRFTQADPAGMKATKLENPQTLNLYVYCVNDPVNHTDPSGLGFFSFIKKAFHWIKQHWKIILVAVVVAVAVLLIPGAPGFLSSFFQGAGKVALSALGAAAEEGGLSTKLKLILGGAIAGAIAGLGTLIQQKKKNSFEKATDRAFDDVEKILKKGGPCAKFFGPDALAALNAMRSAPRRVVSTGNPGNTPTGIEMSVPNTSTGGYRAPNSVTFFLNGPFFIGINKPPLGGYTAGSHGAQIVAIVHELAHLVKKADGSGFLIPNDGGNPSLSSENTQKILKECAKEIFNQAK
jgi:RHS repeat-associated protein